MNRSARGAPRAGPPVARARREWIVAAIVGLLAMVAFLPALNAGFVSWDDDKNFTANVAYRGLGPVQLAWMWSTFHLGTWIPLSWMTLGLDYVLWGMNPAGYHLTNLILHGANAVVLYFVADRILRASGAIGEHDTTVNAMLPAAFAALFFALHPQRVESVAWITERRDVLSGLFYFGAVLAYLRSVAGAPRPQRAYWGSVALFACALLAKGTAVTLPATLLILNLYPLRRLGGISGWLSAAARRVYVELIPFVTLSAAITVIVFVALQPVEQLGVSGKVAVSAYSLWFYFARTIVPVQLSALYSLPEVVDPARVAFMVSYAAVLAGAVAAWTMRRRWPGASIALLAFAAILFPLLGVHQGGPQIAADRITYNAAPALALLAGAAFALGARRHARATIGIGGALLLVLGTLTWKQTLTWRDSRSLWEQVLRVEPDSPLGNNNYGNLLIRDGDVTAAITHYRAAIAAKPAFADAWLNLGVAVAMQDDFGDAIAAYRKALEIRPAFADAESNLGAALARTGDLAGAMTHYARALAIDPTHADAHVNWGNALVRSNRHDEAFAHYREALRYRPDAVDAHVNWGVALAQLGRSADAAAQFELALTLQPGNSEVRELLSRVRASAATPPR